MTQRPSAKITWPTRIAVIAVPPERNVTTSPARMRRLQIDLASVMGWMDGISADRRLSVDISFPHADNAILVRMHSIIQPETLPGLTDYAVHLIILDKAIQFRQWLSFFGHANRTQ